MNYETLSVEFLQRYFGLLRNHGRSTAKRYGGKCGKEMFVARTFGKWLNGKSYVVVMNDGTGITVTDTGNAVVYRDPVVCHNEINVPRKHYVYVSGCAFYLGYGDDLNVCYRDVFSSLVFNTKKVGYNYLLDLYYREIPCSEYDHVASLFSDDRDEVEFTVEAYVKKGDMNRVDLVVKAHDRGEAREKATREHPELVVYG